MQCPENKVPGWLDEDDNPQGCVDNNPTPLEPIDKLLPPADVEAEVIELQVEPEPIMELAETGVSDWFVPLVLGAVALITLGSIMFAKGARRG